MTIKSAGHDESHIRPGEVQIPLPAEADASLYFIGRIRTPWTARKECPKNARASREAGTVCTIEVDPRWHQALPGVETCSHLIVLYWMDRARRDLAVQVPKQYGDGKPTFSLRSPVRPNPIALAVVELRKVEGNVLHVVGVDCLDNTPLLDIKPYFSTTDSIPDARVGWHADRKSSASTE
jgi:tRNA-Thr(GGU) m(6)t(6)A37 methyltransferase TsaA